MTIYDFGSLFYDSAIHVNSTEDVDLLNELLPAYYENSLLLLNPKNGLESDILRLVKEDAVCDDFDENIIRQALVYGYYPMSMEKRITSGVEFDTYNELISFPYKYTVARYFMTIRHHEEKMIIDFNDFKYPKKAHKWSRQKFGEYTLTFNKNFRLCAQTLAKQYAGNTWVVEPLINAFENINKNPDNEISIDSVELWHGNELVAGELGFITHNAYASLCGFHTEDNSGTIQMAALGEYLKANGFAYWDLGMEMDYKYVYGAKLLNRGKQAEYYNKLSEERLALTNKEIKIKELL